IITIKSIYYFISSFLQKGFKHYAESSIVVNNQNFYTHLIKIYRHKFNAFAIFKVLIKTKGDELTSPSVEEFTRFFKSPYYIFLSLFHKLTCSFVKCCYFISFF